MNQENQIIIGGNNKGDKILFDPAMANRHGLISGATGTGKTITLQLLAESFSRTILHAYEDSLSMTLLMFIPMLM